MNEIKELFNKLKNYPITPVREIYMFLMHGRKFGEVVSLDWRDIDFQKNIYTIRAINYKARIDFKKLEKLRILFPNKTEKQLVEVLEILD